MSSYRSPHYGSSTNESAEALLQFLTTDESPQARTLYVGNVDARVTRKMLYELMVQAGPVESITLSSPREHATKTMAFVRFEHAASVRYAMLIFDQISLFRTPLSLNYSGIHKAKPRPQYPPTAPTFFEMPPGLEKVSDENKELLASANAIPPLDYVSGYSVAPQQNGKDDYDQNYDYSGGNYYGSSSYPEDANTRSQREYGSYQQHPTYASSARDRDYSGGYENYSQRDVHRSHSAGYYTDRSGHDTQRYSDRHERRDLDRHDSYSGYSSKKPRR